MALVNTIPALGTIVGSGFASTLMQQGRAKALMRALILGIIGSILT